MKSLMFRLLCLFISGKAQGLCYLKDASKEKQLLSDDLVLRCLPESQRIVGLSHQFPPETKTPEIPEFSTVTQLLDMPFSVFNN